MSEVSNNFWMASQMSANSFSTVCLYSLMSLTCCSFPCAKKKIAGQRNDFEPWLLPFARWTRWFARMPGVNQSHFCKPHWASCAPQWTNLGCSVRPFACKPPSLKHKILKFTGMSLCIPSYRSACSANLALKTSSSWLMFCRKREEKISF